MKKTWILLLCIFCAGYAHAQSAQLGLGLSANIPTGFGYGLGFGGGIQGEFKLKNNISLQPSVNYYRLYSRRFSFSDGSTTLSVRGNTNLFNFSPAVNFYLGGGKAYLQAGPSVYVQDDVLAGVTAGFGLKLAAGTNVLDVGLKTENMISDGIFNFVALKAAYCLNFKK